MKHVETGAADPMVDCVPAKSRFLKLIAPHHPVLPLRESGNDSVDRTRVHLTAHTAVK